MVDFPVIVRPVDCAYATIRQAIDRGPCGFLLPGIESAEEMDRVRDAVYMPPRGRRRPGGPGNAWVSSFHYDRWKEEVEDEFIVLPQIETRAELANVDAIAAHEVQWAAIKERRCGAEQAIAPFKKGVIPHNLFPSLGSRLCILFFSLVHAHYFGQPRSGAQASGNKSPF